jgi:glycosyltransferase involved in cell wall biosynthesis
LNPIHLYLRTSPAPDRYFPGDHFLISLLKKLFRPKRTSGIDKVFFNLVKGFDELKVSYDINRPFHQIKPGEPVVVLGKGRFALQGYTSKNPVIAGIALMTHPYEWPELCSEYPVARYLQHSGWTRDIYLPYYGGQVCALWPAGIDTAQWSPPLVAEKQYDVLIYKKIMWPDQEASKGLSAAVTAEIESRGLTCREIVYGHYREDQYRDLLKGAQAMVFLCEHESQGFACCEALSMNVPVFAWDQGAWLDPNRTIWREKHPVHATSVPFFDDRCGARFKNIKDFGDGFDHFWKNVRKGSYLPREYVLENLTLKKSAQKMLDIIKSVYP